MNKKPQNDPPGTAPFFTELSIRDGAESPSTKPLDLLFGIRKTWVGKSARVAGEAFAHVAATLDGTTTIELGPGGILQRSVDEFRESVVVFGLARPSLSSVCSSSIASELRVVCHEPARYSWTLAALRGALELLRRPLSEAHATQLGAQVGRATNLLHPVVIATCSSWIHHAYSAACESCWPRIGWPVQAQTSIFSPSAVEAHRSKNWTDRAFPQRNNQLVSPSDLWVIPPYEARWSTSQLRTIQIREDRKPALCMRLATTSQKQGGEA